MNKRSDQNPDVQSAAGNTGYPPMMEIELEELANHLNPQQQRLAAAKFERWSLQLRFSAEAIERDGLSPEITPAAACLDPNIAEQTKGMKPSDMLELADMWSAGAQNIREALGYAASDTQITGITAFARRN